jgi:hypothetical protein
MKWGWDYGREPIRLSRIRLSERDTVVRDSDYVDLPTPFNFKIQKATGGTTVEVNHYDRKRDETVVNLHIIPDEVEDVAGAIGRIVTIELLKA